MIPPCLLFCTGIAVSTFVAVEMKAGTTVTNCEATGGGGGIYVLGAVVTGDGTTIVRNCSARYGGGLAVSDEEPIAVTGLVFNQCTARELSGGAIKVTGGSNRVNLTDLVISVGRWLDLVVPAVVVLENGVFGCRCRCGCWRWIVVDMG